MRLLLVLLLTACTSLGQHTVPQVTGTPSTQSRGVTWVTDAHNNAVRIYQDTTLAHTVTLPPNMNPTGVAVGPDGNAHIAFTGANLVVTMDPSGNILSSFDVPNPRGVTYDPNGNLWVAVTTSPQSYAAEYNAADDVIGKVYTPNVSVFLGVWAIAVDGSGDVFMDTTDGGPGSFVYECSGKDSNCTRIAVTPAIGGIAFRANLYVGFGFDLKQYAPPDWHLVGGHNYGLGHGIQMLSVNANGVMYVPTTGLGVFIVPENGTGNLFIPDKSATGAAGE